jgi:hypothetical protein
MTLPETPGAMKPLPHRPPHVKAYSRTEITWEGTPVAIGCYDCGIPYGDDAWIEILVPNDVWAVIAPHDGQGLLCINCIAQRCVEAGLENVPMMVETGPLVISEFKLKTPFLVGTART